MQNVPKIVRDRLQAAPPAVNHPDADLLTAFAERSLPDRERTVVLEHLARCGDCRGIVALSLPEVESVQTTVRPSPSGWLTWPALRWGFVAAGVVAVASLGILQFQRRAQHATTASSLNQSAPVEIAANEPKKEVDRFVAPTAKAEKQEKLQDPAQGCGCWRQRGRDCRRPATSRHETFESIPAAEQCPESDSCSRASGVREAARRGYACEWARPSSV